MKEPRIPEDPQAKITALLLGELGPAEAEEVRRRVEQDPEWGALHDRLRQAIGLIREVMGRPEDLGEEKQKAEVGMRFSEARRAALLRQFKVLPMRGAAVDEKLKGRTNWVAVAALLVVMAVLAAMLLPSMAKSKAKAKSIARMNDQRSEFALARQMPENQVASGEALSEPEMMTRYGVGRKPESVPPSDSASGARRFGGVADAVSVRGREMFAASGDAGGRAGFGGGGGGGADGQGILTSNAGGRGGWAFYSNRGYSGGDRQLMRQEIVLPNSGGMAGGAQLQERYGVNVAGGEAAFGRGLAAGKPVITPAEVTEWAMDRGTVAGVGAVNGPVESAPVLGDMPVVGEAFGLEAKTASLEPSAFGDFENDGARDLFVNNAADAVFDTGVSAPSGGAAGMAAADEMALGRETTTFFAGAAMVPEQPELEVQSALRQQTRAEAPRVTRGLALAPRASVEVLDVALAGSEGADLKTSLSARVEEGAEVESVDKLARLDAFVEQAGVVVVPERPEVQVRELSEARAAGRKSARDTSLGVPLRMNRYSAPAPTAAPRPASVAPAPALVDAPAEVQDLAKRKDAAGDAVDGLSLGFAPMKGQGVELEGRFMEEREVLWEESSKKVPALSVVERLGELEVGQKEEKQVALEDHYYAMVTNASVAVPVPAPAPAAGVAYGSMGTVVQAMEPVIVDPMDANEDLGRRPALVPPLVPQPEVQAADNPFSTFSLNVADVSFKLAQASLEQGRLPDPGSIRSEEFINAFRYHDPAPVPGRRVGVTWERARYPFAHNRDLLRFGVQTAAQGREAGRPLNLVLCIDSSGSMKRADRVAILRSAMEVLAGQLRPEDRFSVVAFARTARLISSGLDGTRAEELVRVLAQLNPEGGTNLEDALRLAYESAHANYVSGGVNRVVLMTDGAANLGNVDGELMRQSVIRERKNGIALDSFGVGWEGYNDDLLETLSRNGDGRYGFLNSPEQVAVDFADQLAGALRVAASDVKVQMEFNARRVKSYRQIGYAKHQLTKEQFRDNTVDAAELGAAEAGQALYVVETDPAGVGPVGTLRVRFKVPETGEVTEEEWMIPYEGQAVELAAASPAMRLAATASACSEWLAESPYAAEVTAPRLLELLRGVPESFELEPRPRQLEWMIRQAGSILGQ